MPAGPPPSRPPDPVYEMSPGSRPPARPHRSLSGEVVDLIRNGVAKGPKRDRRVWNALGSTSLGAHNAGWSEAEWKNLVMDHASVLGKQVRVRANGKERTAVQAEKLLTDGWQRGAARAVASPVWTTDQAHAEAIRRADELLLVAANADLDLIDAERGVLVFAADEARRLKCTRVNLPRRTVGQAVEIHLAETGELRAIGEKQARNRLDELDDLGLLIRVDRGRASDDPTKRRAGVYELPGKEALARATAAVLGRGTRQVGPSTRTGGPQDSPALGLEPPTGGPLDDRVFTQAEIVAVLGADALGRLEDRRPPRDSRNREDHPLARARVCAIGGAHKSHPHGPISAAGGLAFWCPGKIEPVESSEEAA